MPIGPQYRDTTSLVITRSHIFGWLGMITNETEITSTKKRKKDIIDMQIARTSIEGKDSNGFLTEQECRDYHTKHYGNLFSNIIILLSE